MEEVSRVDEEESSRRFFTGSNLELPFCHLACFKKKNEAFSWKEKEDKISLSCVFQL